MGGPLLRVRSLAARLRPAEWFLLGFAAFAVVKVILARSTPGALDLLAPPSVRLDMAWAFLTVVAVGQGVAYRARPWPAGSPFARVHGKLFAATLIPPAAALWLMLQLPSWGLGGFYEATLVRGLFLGYWVYERLAMSFLPFLVLWLGMGLHLKKYGKLQLRALAADAFASTGALLRDWAPPVLLMFMYSGMGWFLEHNQGPDRDAQLAAIDRLMFFGHEPVLALQYWMRPWLSNWLTFCYGFYLVLFPLGLALASLRGRRDFQELSLSVTSALAIGFILYTVVPAMGPAFTMHFNVPFEPYFFETIKDDFIDKYRVPRDCFPSLHTGMSLVFLLHARRRSRPLYWALLPIVASIPFACLYLRYHYVIDLIAGTVLAVAMDLLSVRLVARGGAADAELEARPEAALQPVAEPGPSA